MSRRIPYTEKGISRAKCSHCGEPAAHQWSLNACADGNRKLWYPLCIDCDIALNELSLRFMNDPDVDEKMRVYKKLLGWEEGFISYSTLPRNN